MPKSSYAELHALAGQFGTPFYLFHPEEFMANLHEIDAAFRSRYPEFIIGYSYKTNYLPYLCRLVKDSGGYAEVVSRLEYDLALKIGQDPKTIIFNGPVKSRDDIELALRNQSLLNLDAWYEVDYVVDYARRHPRQSVAVGLRVNIDLTDTHGVSNVQAGLASGRFGFEVSAEGIYRALQVLANEPNVQVAGLHGHCSSSSRTLWVYERITSQLCDIVVEAGLESIRYIDVGGGIFGKIPQEMRWTDTPTFDDYAETICRVLKRYPWVRDRQPTLILEPGVAVTANCMSFVASVVDIKHLGVNRYVLVDGSIYNVKPSMHKHNQPHAFYCLEPRAGEGRYKVCGYTCMEKDILLDDIVAGTLGRGDYLKIDNVGAYTIVMSPPFITTFPPIIARVDGTLQLLRQRQDFEGFFSDYRFS